MDTKMLVAKALRQLFVDHGVSNSGIWNNKYPTGTRTVKCYRYEIDDEFTLREAIDNLMSGMAMAFVDCPSYKVKVTDSYNTYRRGFIVRLY